jgi:hypothetical protein
LRPIGLEYHITIEIDNRLVVGQHIVFVTDILPEECSGTVLQDFLVADLCAFAPWAGDLNTYFAKCDPVHNGQMMPARRVSAIVFRRDDTAAGFSKGSSAGE